MSEQAIVERIISDAHEEAQQIIEAAEKKASASIAEANLRAERNKKGCEAEAREKAKSISDGKAAAARLDCAKILLAEKRGVIDDIYARALAQLIDLNKTDTLFLAEKLLSSFAENGDTVVFAENYRYAEDVGKLSVFKEKKLKASKNKGKFEGGFMLCGKTSDKDLSYGALLSADRESYQAEIAAAIFTV